MRGGGFHSRGGFRHAGPIHHRHNMGRPLHRGFHRPRHSFWRFNTFWGRQFFRPMNFFSPFYYQRYLMPPMWYDSHLFFSFLSGALIYKLLSSDVQKIESASGKKIQNMDEEELKSTMDQTGVQSKSLTEEEKEKLRKLLE